MAKLLPVLGTELSTRMYRVTAAFNDALYSATNEPSLGMYRIQEHVSVTVPRLVEQQQYLRENCQRVEGASYDIEYDTKTLKDMAGITQFTGIRNNLVRAIQLKQQLDEADAKRRMTRPFPPPQASLPAHTHPPHPPTSSHLSLPPSLVGGVAETTPPHPPVGINLSDDYDDVDIATLEAVLQEAKPEVDIRPKSFD